MYQKNAPIGALAIQFGYATSDQVLAALEEQQALRAKGSKCPPLGHILVQRGAITGQQLADLLSRSENQGLPVAPEAYQLANRIRAHFDDQIHKMLLLTSVDHGDGAAETAAQISFALSLLENGRVLLLDANFRDTQLARFMGADDENALREPGLAELMQQKIAPEKAIRRTTIPTLSYLPTGNRAVDFVSLLISRECLQLMDVLRQRFDYVIVNTTPMLHYPDAGILAPASDGIVASIAKGKRRSGELTRLKTMIDGLKTPLLGVVLFEPSSGGKSTRGPVTVDERVAEAQQFNHAQS
jgi:Mrp family chromosome partitioning ATPase